LRTKRRSSLSRVKNKILLKWFRDKVTSYPSSVTALEILRMDFSQIQLHKKKIKTTSLKPSETPKSLA